MHFVSTILQRYTRRDFGSTSSDRSIVGAARAKELVMPIRQVVPKQQFDAGSITTLRLAPMSDEPVADASSFEQVSIAAPTARRERDSVVRMEIQAMAAMAQNADQGRVRRDNDEARLLAASMSSRQIRTRSTGARRSRVLFTCAALLMLGYWFWLKR